jgi:hypothetical protein
MDNDLQNVQQPTDGDNQQQDQGAQGSEAIFSRDDLARMVSEQVNKKLAENNAKWEEKVAAAVEKAKQDGKDEATMSAKELADKKAKEDAERMQQREAEIDKRLAELDRRERLANARDLLASEGLPTDAAEMMLGADNNQTKANIAKLKGLVDQAVKDQLHRDSAQQEPTAGGSNHPAPTKKFSEMTLDEQTALYRDNPDLYRQLMQQQ